VTDDAAAAVAGLRLLIGSYTATGGGTATGISVVEDGVARTVAVLDDPSFLAVTDDRVYAVTETLDGAVHAFRRSGTTLEHRWTADAGGDAPCHVLVDPRGVLVVTNYTSGTVTAIGLEAAETASAAAPDSTVGTHGDGTGTPVVPASAVATAVLPDVTGPVEDRQEGPHAHQSTGTPDGTVLVTDLGGDALHEFRLATDADGSVTLEVMRVHHVEPGTGPRHMGWWDGDLLVAGELDGCVHRLRRDDAGAFRTVVATPVASATAPASGTGEVFLSHLEVDDRGLVTVAVRGRDEIVVLDAADGGLTVVHTVSAGGVWPRHFARAGDVLLVANQMSDAVAVLPIGADGFPQAAIAQIAVGTPACIVPLAAD
jgi:6-phosphogluconolactonase